MFLWNLSWLQVKVCYIDIYLKIDLLDDVSSTAFQELLLKVCNFFGEHRIKALPRHYQLKHQDRAVKFCSKYILPFLMQLFGTISFFFYCFGRTVEGKEVIQKQQTEISQEEQKKYESELLKFREIGRHEMAEAIQHHYGLSGIFV